MLSIECNFHTISAANGLFTRDVPMLPDRKNSIADLIRAEAKRNCHQELRDIPRDYEEPTSPMMWLQNLAALTPVFILVYSALYIFLVVNNPPPADERSRRRAVTQQIQASRQWESKSIGERIRGLTEAGVLPSVAIFLLSVFVILAHPKIMRRRI